MSFCTDGAELIGYTDRWSAQPGDALSLHVSSSHGSVDVDIVRLRHGDPNPDGPGFQTEPVESAVTGTYPAFEQSIGAGSYAVLTEAGAPAMRLSLWVWTLLPAAGHDQTLLSRGDLRLYLDGDGVPMIAVGDEVRAVCAHPLPRERWQHLEVTLDEESPAGPVILAASACGRRHAHTITSTGASKNSDSTTAPTTCADSSSSMAQRLPSRVGIGKTTQLTSGVHRSSMRQCISMKTTSKTLAGRRLRHGLSRNDSQPVSMPSGSGPENSSTTCRSSSHPRTAPPPPRSRFCCRLSHTSPTRTSG